MRDNIYEYLREYGFSKEKVQSFDKENDEMYDVNLNDVKENIIFLESKGLNKNEIITLINNNPFMLTTAFNRRDAYDKIYMEKLKLTNDEIKYLLLKNSDTYTNSPIELDKIIDYLLNEKKYSYYNIKNIILNNPNIINLSLEELKKIY